MSEYHKERGDPYLAMKKVYQVSSERTVDHFDSGSEEKNCSAIMDNPIKPKPTEIFNSRGLSPNFGLRIKINIGENIKIL